MFTTPNKIGPVYTTALTPTAQSFASGSARIAWTGTNDPDDPTLQYQVLRDSSTTPIYMYQESFQFYKLGYGTAMALVLLVIGAIFSLIYVRLIKVDDL